MFCFSLYVYYVSYNVLLFQKPLLVFSKKVYICLQFITISGSLIYSYVSIWLLKSSYIAEKKTYLHFQGRFIFLLTIYYYFKEFLDFLICFHVCSSLLKYYNREKKNIYIFKGGFLVFTFTNNFWIFHTNLYVIWYRYMFHHSC